ncbi:MAG: enoyl-CoA hydratase/isomerase family protein [Fibrobacterota bacterium]
MKEFCRLILDKTGPLYFDEFDKVGYIILNNPPENRMTLRFFNDLQTIVSSFVDRRDLTGIIICSNGRHFSSGAALPELLTILEDAQQAGAESKPQLFTDANQECFRMLSSLPVPVVAVLKGLCAGSAYELALCADIRIAEERTTLGLPEVQYDVIPGCGGTVRLTKLIGAAPALDLLLSGRLLSSDEAYALGLVDMVVPRKKGVLHAETLLNSGAISLRAKTNLSDAVSQIVNNGSSQ